MEQDEEGNTYKYDKVGDRVESEESFDEENPDQQFESTLIGVHKGKKQKYRYKAPKQVDQDAELDKLLSANQIFTFEDNESEISELREFHESADVPAPIIVDHELEKMVSKERSELVFAEKDDNEDGELIEFRDKGDDEDLPEGAGGDIEGIAGSGVNEDNGLTDSELHQ